ncbi:hypothetical protein PSHT_04076 [Puccinia striiformis]|uniref:Uncharacterized protein n=1 Tax=Puccinia striiformis TaxID=27350 RepID=A0A2S4WDQ6_9BASI|nr:hypothetical protein PSHT_04076 [Puccinia striiformis]
MSSDRAAAVLDPSLFGLGPINIDLKVSNPTKRLHTKKMKIKRQEQSKRV